MPEEPASSDVITGEKWKANQEKVAYMKTFPGLVTEWEQSQGKTVQAVVGLPSKAGAVVLVFSDGHFVVAPPIAPEPWDLGEGLAAARRYLEPRHRDAYVKYDRLVQTDREALRKARLEKIIGAIQNNLKQIPELKDRLRRLVDEWK
jgi:diglucosylglycerate octanoyltransferase